ncbi:taurine catabolism dioxygenase [Delitschia confertaspora ATCC 74209]|uniref:Taurine catabolism dioxygenase n=1 Tax=Delitschia confertaspora ATCC 74209 TaxID=1513339 RepID=A0A9P4MX72_9PLEO|nr:taurine catabolism dioxygenase [Delitschia confertaspora ATCC 74209]
MPGFLSQDNPFKTITIKELHPTYAAEIFGANFQDMSEEQFQEIRVAMAKYGVLVFRNTGLSDTQHVKFSERIGELDNIARYLTAGRKARYAHLELFDASNLDDNGDIITLDNPRSHYNKGNALFHVDSSFNPRRSSWSLLRAVKLPPPGTGGETEFADSRTAFEELDEGTKALLLKKHLLGAHTLLHSRKLGSPEFFKDLDPESQPMARHKIAQLHEPSGRMNLYIATHCHHIESYDPATDKLTPMSKVHSDELLHRLLDQVTQPKYVLSVDWHNESDLVAWDNTAVLHRATGGSFEGKYKRDMRRTTVHDGSSTAWGFNDGMVATGFARTLQGAMSGGTNGEEKRMGKEKEVEKGGVDVGA